ncbi:hypothetical protein LC612_31125 [Nostoc sp. CHAB 5834]|nr:hypothetical protein [Nostoc sp. CHAB 5834]
MVDTVRVFALMQARRQFLLAFIAMETSSMYVPQMQQVKVSVLASIFFRFGLLPVL